MLRKIRQKLLNPVMWQLDAMQAKLDSIASMVESQGAQNKDGGDCPKSSVDSDNATTATDTTNCTKHEDSGCTAEATIDGKIYICNFSEYDEFVRKCIEQDFGNLDFFSFSTQYRLNFDSFVKLYGTPHPYGDPFSDEYRQWEMSFFEFLSGKAYSFEVEGEKY